MLYLPIAGTDEFYLLENRQAQESDTAQMTPSFGARYKAPGLLVWHIDQGQLDTHGFVTDNRVNVGPVHGVALVQADGRQDLSQPGGQNRGDAGDSYPGSSGNTSLCRNTIPASVNNQGDFAGFCLESIQPDPVGRRVRFRYVPFRSVFAADHVGAKIQVNGSWVARVDQFFAPGTLIELAADSVQINADLRTRFEFLAWSNGAARHQTLTVGELPDTVLAHMAAAYQLRMSVRGAAAEAVSSGALGDIRSGVFLAEGSSISLRAAPQPDAVFLNWTGDTISTRDTLTLRMLHPFSVVANFIGVQQVTLPDAAESLLGSSVLGAQQAVYLDAAGNRNGTYDLGDFLAAADRSATPVLARARVRRRGPMTASRPQLWLGLILVLAGCSNSTGPTAGILNLTVASPHKDDGGIMLSVYGGPVDSVEAVGYVIHAARAADSVKMIVTGNLGSGVIARVHIPDSRQAARYSVQITQVAARQTYAQRDPAGYTVSLAR